MMSNEIAFTVTNLGATSYTSPEQLVSMMSSIKSDIWALGCLLYEITCL